MILGIALLIAQFSCGVIFVELITVECNSPVDVNCNDGLVTSWNLHDISSDVRPTFIGIEFCFVTIQSVLFIMLYILCKDLLLIMIYFHDYLIAYK
jgi:hypothetical protein